MPEEPAFGVVLDADLDEVLVVGMADLGVGGLTAVDHCVAHLESTPVGHVRSRDLPDLPPFSDGVPRRPIRLYSLDGTGVTVLVSEVFLPVRVAEPLADALIDTTTEHGVEEITVLNGGSSRTRGRSTPSITSRPTSTVSATSGPRGRPSRPWPAGSSTGSLRNSSFGGWTARPRRSAPW
ncbi:MAG: putative ATP-grasp superfamily ATP-dependent carboligase [Halobacteriales archaeon]|jgi:predicted ATP-grasp superfamily ATP-dependent carboligase